MGVQDVYRHLPAAIQNFAITAYSYFIYNKKYNKKQVCPDILDSCSTQSRERILSAFQELISCAIDNVPFYSAIAQKHNISAADVTLLNYKDYFPIITKEDIRKDPSQFYAVGGSEKLLTLFTSGTSGSPLEIKCFPADRKKNYDFFRAILVKHGVDVFSESATFAGRVLFHSEKNNTYWRRDGFLKTTYFSTYHMSDETLSFYIQELNSRKPKFIDSYPSALMVVARFVRLHGVSLTFTPNLILTSSETLTDSMKEEISAAFNGALIVDHYGCTEMGVMAYSDTIDKYEFPAQYSLVEFSPIDNDMSKIICTSLINKGMPLIRYDIGDVCLNASISANGDQICEKIIGREDDLILTPEGNRVGRLDPVFKGVSGIDKAQIIQTEISALVVKVVLLKESGWFDEAVLKENLRGRVGQKMKISVVIVDGIELTKSGKFKSVISML